MSWANWPLEERIAVICGLTGQIMFTGRFVAQWIASERAGKSVTPRSFWHLSIAGSLILLGYAIYRRDPVIILGQAFGTFVYFRNLVLIDRHEARERAVPAGVEPATAN